MRDHHLDLSEAEQKWFIFILLGGAVYNMGLALGLGIQVLALNSMIIERVV